MHTGDYKLTQLDRFFRAEFLAAETGDAGIFIAHGNRLTHFKGRHRTMADAVTAGSAFRFINVPGLFYNLHIKVAHITA